MGHAGAIVSGKQGTAQEKIATLEKRGIRVIRQLGQIGETFKGPL
jgi:succinyl-CoA synthetase alpha subunit